MSDDAVLYEVSDHIATVTLNRPERLNAYNAAIRTGVIDSLRRADADIDVRAVILTGAGRAFCAGLDLKERAEHGPAPTGQQGSDDDIRKPFIEVDVPLIAAINGPAVGIGSEMAILCDFRIMAEGSYLNDMHVKRGMVPDIGASWLLPRMIGWSRACELFFTADPIDAETAKEFGLANRVVPSNELITSARDFASRIAANAPLAVRRAKRLMREGLTSDFYPNARAGLDVNRELGQTDDFKEGMRSFIERRPAAFQGR